MQIVTASSVVIVYEKAMDCIEELCEPGKPPRIVFTAPIPTEYGLLCKDCQVCQICGMPTGEVLRHDGCSSKVCLSCTDYCSDCGQGKIRHHICCTSSTRR